MSPEIVFKQMLPSWIIPTMPKIAIEKDANSFFLKNDIGFSLD